ncbi:MAG: arginine deiminase family protein [Bacteroidota bacterium]|nr:arginine deiminase family protein [Bacteroidota bacterium]
MSDIRFSMTAPLQRVLVAHAGDCFRSPEWLAAHWREAQFLFEPDYDEACLESDRFIAILEDAGASVEIMDTDLCVGLDSLYVHDPVAACGPGLLLGRMGKETRKPEVEAMKTQLERLGLQPKAMQDESALLEGGDVVWLHPDLVAVGQGFRTNAAGLNELAAFCGDSVREVIPVSLPWWTGYGDVLHIMSLVSPLDEHHLLIHSRLMPVAFRQRLAEEGFTLLEVPASEYDSLGGNVLSLGNRTCLIEMHNVQTIRLLEDAGFRVLTYSGRHISLAGSGGPTCLTRPLLRG